MIVLKILDKVFSRVSDITNTIAACLLFVSFMMIALNSLRLIVFSTSTIWTDELSLFVYVVSIFFVLTHVEYESSAICMSFFYDKTKKGTVARFIFDAIRWAASLFTAYIFFNSGILAIQRMNRINTIGLTTKIPYKYIYGVIMFSVALWILYLLCKPLIAIGKRGDRLE